MMKRIWAMPTKNTFECKPIGGLVRTYLSKSKLSIDPFARNKDWATYTNDINPNTKAQQHRDAYDFLLQLKNDGTHPDLVIFDPPYSPRQVKECYESFGKKFESEDAWRTHSWTKEKEIINEIMAVGGVFLYFGWDSCGMGKNRGFAIQEILLVAHGPGHHDTICTVEKKVQSRLIIKQGGKTPCI